MGLNPTHPLGQFSTIFPIRKHLTFIWWLAQTRVRKHSNMHMETIGALTKQKMNSCTTTRTRTYKLFQQDLMLGKRYRFCQIYQIPSYGMK